MIVPIALALVPVVVLTGAGLVLLALVRPGDRTRLLPFTPLLGVAGAVIVLHWHAWVAPIGAAPWILPLVILAAGTFGFLYWRRAVALSAAQWSDALPVLVGLVPMLLALLPSIRLGTSRPVLTTGSHDAAYYVSVSRWLIDHTGLELPQIGTGPASGIDAPSFGAAYSTLDLPLRYGQELLQSWLSAASGVDVLDGFGPWMAASLVFLTVAAVMLLRSLGLTSRWSLAGGLAAAMSLSVLAQFGAQNADSLLGIALALATIGAMQQVLRPTDGAAPLPVWLPAMLLAGCVGVYSELLIFLAPILAAQVVLRPRGLSWRSLGLGAFTVLLSVLLCPPAWIRGVRGLMAVGAPSDAPEGPIDPVHAVILLFGPLRHLAIDPRFESVRWVGLAVLGVLGILAVAGIIAAARVRATRALAVGAIGALVVLALLALRGDEYVYSRGIDMLTPIVICIAVAGLAAVPSLLPTAVRVARVAVGVVVAGWLGLNVAGYAATMPPDPSDRTVSGEFDEARAWVERVQGGSGSTLAVAVPGFFDQVWLADALRDWPDVSYPYLRGDLGYLGVDLAETFVDPLSPRPDYLVVGRAIAAQGSVVHENGRLRLLDLRTGQFAIALPTAPNAAWPATVAEIDGEPALVSAGAASLELMLDAQTRSVVLALADADGEPLPVTTPTSIATDGWRAEWASPGNLRLERTPSAPDSARLRLGGAETQWFVKGLSIDG